MERIDIYLVGFLLLSYGHMAGRLSSHRMVLSVSNSWILGTELAFHHSHHFVNRKVSVEGGLRREGKETAQLAQRVFMTSAAGWGGSWNRFRVASTAAFDFEV